MKTTDQLKKIEKDILSVMNEYKNPIDETVLINDSKFKTISEYGLAYCISRLIKRNIIEFNDNSKLVIKKKRWTSKKN